MNASQRRYVIDTRSRLKHIIYLSLSYGLTGAAIGLIWWALSS